MAQQDWTAAKLLLELGADPKALTTYGKDAVYTYCSKIARSVRSRQTQGVVYDLGVLLKIPELRPDCVADMERFPLKKKAWTRPTRSSAAKVGQWLAGMLSVLGLFAPARASSLDASRYFSDAKTIDFVDSLQRGNASKVKKALAAGQDPNAEGLQGIRPIHFVYRRPNLEAVEALLQAGADPNLPAPNGNRPLHYAVQHETADLALLLFEVQGRPGPCLVRTMNPCSIRPCRRGMRRCCFRSW